MESGKAKHRYRSISLLISVIEKIDRLIKELDYWPSRAAFVREACIEKIEKHRAELKARRDE